MAYPAAERIAQSLRRRAGLKVRDLPSLAVERLGYRVLVEDLGPRVKGHSEDGSKIIRLAPQPYLPAMLFVLAHEFMELSVSRHYQGKLRERICQRGAAAFLLPSIAFKHTLWKSGWDLRELLNWWPWASWEALGFRVADLYPWASFTVWSDTYFRRSGGTEPTELELAAYLMARKGRALLARDGQVVSAWRLTESGVQMKVAALSVAQGQEPKAWMAEGTSSP